MASPNQSPTGELAPDGPLRTLFSRVKQSGDIGLVIGVLAIIGLLVLRVPPGVMDYFLAINIGLSLTILIVVLSLRDALQLPALPTILLLVTLFRLALNVATTRLILLEGDAGTIISAFGGKVVGGNFVVGAVVFLVIVIVQFVVIAKGSERVAEVAARFTLDAMQGKQVAIDNELRAGHIDQDEAQSRRADLERESRLFGSMDGAMKFVKGDAIAGIIISLVNIVGGLIIGVAQQGMDITQAAEVYSLLTIGDGLVSQIPALLISVGAGIAVTRVSSARAGADSTLASELVEQLGSRSRSLAIAGGALLFVGVLSPLFHAGFQPIPFLIMGAILILPAIADRATAKDAAEESKAEGRVGGVEDASNRDADSRKLPFEPHPVTVRWSAGARTKDEVAAFQARMAELQRRLSERWGFRMPEPRLERDPADTAGATAGFVIRLNGRTVRRVRLPGPEEAALVAPVERLGAERFTATRLGSIRGASGRQLEVACVTQRDLPRILGHPMWKGSPPGQADPLDIMEAAVELVMGAEPAQLFGLAQITELSERLSQNLPEFHRANARQLPRLTRVLRGLLGDGISLRRMGPILECVAGAPEVHSVDQIVHGIRTAIRDDWFPEVFGASGTIRTVEVTPELEAAVRAGKVDHESRVAIKAAVHRAVRAAMKSAPGVPVALVVDSWQARGPLAEHVNRGEAHRIRVVCTAELPAHWTIERAGTATMEVIPDKQATPPPSQ